MIKTFLLVKSGKEVVFRRGDAGSLSWGPAFKPVDYHVDFHQDTDWHVIFYRQPEIYLHNLYEILLQALATVPLSYCSSPYCSPWRG